MKVYGIRDDLYPVLDELAEGGLLEVNYETDYIGIKVIFNDDNELEDKWFKLEDLISLTESSHESDYSTSPTTWVSKYPDDEIRVQYYNC